MQAARAKMPAALLPLGFAIICAKSEQNSSLRPIKIEWMDDRSWHFPDFGKCLTKVRKEHQSGRSSGCCQHSRFYEYTP
jgi:predicted phosphatase